MIEIFVELLCCKDGGIKKAELMYRLLQVGFEEKEIKKLMNRIYYARYRSESFSVILLNDQKKWYTFDNEEYCKGLIRQIKLSACEIPKPSGVPYLVYEKWNQLRYIFIQHGY